MALRLYFDECQNARVLAGIRRRGIDVVSAADEGLLGAGDEEHLRRAIELSRVIVTGDQDFLRLAHDLTEAGETFPGLIFVPNDMPIGHAVRGLEIAAMVLDPADMVGQIEWA